MNKAFTKDSDDDDGPDRPAGPPPPPGRIYITPWGAEKLRKELHELFHVERPKVTQVVSWAAENGDRSENADYTYGKKRLREIDRRIHFLSKRIESLTIIDPTKQSGDEVKFGATVTIRDDEDRERTYSIVGTDEADIERRRISFVSPLAAALLRRKVGDVVVFHSPKGTQEVEILKVSYQSLE